MTTVTVGIPTYNRAEYLKDTLPMILRQTFADFELIVCDDASSDHTAEVVASFADPRIRYNRNTTNLNIPGNLNRILSLADGEFIIILHDHDLFHPELLERSVNLLRSDPSIAFVHPGVAWIDNDGSNYEELLTSFPSVMPGDQFTRAVLTSADFSCPVTACAMVRRSAYTSVGGRYDPTYGFVSDMDMWLRLAAVGNVGYLREPLLICRRRDGDHQFSGVSWQMLEWVSAIHAAQIERFFHGNERTHMQDVWRRKRDRVYSGAVIAAAGQGDVAAFRTGSELVRTHTKSLFAVVLGLVGRVPQGEAILVGLAAGLNRVRRRYLQRLRRGNAGTRFRPPDSAGQGAPTTK